jgi:hypothetical protein
MKDATSQYAAVAPGRSKRAGVVADLVFVASWTALRALVCVPHAGTLERFLAFDTPQPFAGRLLAPLLAWPMVASGWLSRWHSFLLVDAISFLAFLVGLRYALSAVVPASFVRLAGFVIPLLMIPAVFLSAEYPPIFFPYDMPAIAFMAWGIGLALRRRAWGLALLLPLASLNRETSILLPLAWLLLWWDRLPLRASLVAGASVVGAFALSRGLLLFFLRDRPQPYGGSTPLTYRGSLIIDSNVGWLCYPINWPLWIAFLGFVPVLLPALFRHLPDASRRLIPLLAFHLVALTFSGQLDEARIYAEWITLAGILLAPAAATSCGLPAYQHPALDSAVRPAMRNVSAFLRKWAIPLLFIAAALGYVVVHLTHQTPPARIGPG